MIVAVYEDGVLRPIEPLDLPDGSHVRGLLEVLPAVASDEAGLSEVERRRRRVDEALWEAGLLEIPEDVIELPPPLSEREREELGHRRAAGGPISDLIIEEQGGR